MRNIRIEQMIQRKLKPNFKERCKKLLKKYENILKTASNETEKKSIMKVIESLKEIVNN